MPTNVKIADLSADTTPASTDLIVTVDVSDTSASADGTNKVVEFANVHKALSVMVGDSGSGGTKGLVPAPASGDAAAGKFLKADGTFAVPPGTATGTVTTTGSPANGNLTKFSGASSVTNGDLSGDVTTSGTLAATIANGAVTAAKMATNVKTTTLVFIIDGGGSAITTGIKGDLIVDFGCTIQSVTLLADQSGSIVVDIWKDTYANYPPTNADSITASAKPTISTATKSQDSTLTGWTTSISAGDILRFNVDSITTCQRVTVALKVVLT